MMTTCASLIAHETLLAYWLGELDTAAEARTQEHLLGCAECSERLGELVALGRAVRAVTRAGLVSAVINDAFVRRLTEQGVRVREYRVPLNGAVNCTVAPNDDLVVAHLDAPLGDATRIDLVEADSGGVQRARHEDIPFQSASGGVVVVTRMDVLRALPATVTRMRLLSVGNDGERIIGEYTFNHTPHE